MNSILYLLVTVIDGDQLLKVAINYGDINDLPEDFNTCWREPENLRLLEARLPVNCQYPIVEVSELFAIAP